MRQNGELSIAATSGDMPLSKRTRGRPRGGERGKIVDQLMDVTERLLRIHSHFELTEQKIAEQAGTTKAMIHYYFGDKDGLLFAVFARYGDEASEKLRAFDTIDLDSKSIVRRIFEIMIDAYYAKPWISMAMAVELARSNSCIRNAFIRRYGAKGFGMVHLQRLFSRLIGHGIFDARIDVEDAAWSLLSIITTPILLAPLSTDCGPPLARFRQDKWIDHVADLFARQLMASEHRDGPRPVSFLFPEKI